MAKSKSAKERGKFKQIIQKALFESDDIKNILLGDTSGMSKAETMQEFKKYVKSHLFIDDTITETKMFIFYDVAMPYVHTHTETCDLIMYLICHRDILEDCEIEGYAGNRADILSQMVENALINDTAVVRKFGIGDLTLDSIEIYNSSRFYGCIMNFSVPTFR